MKLSIIYLTYRPGGFDMLADSLRNQTMQDYELIIVDDYAEDRSALVKKYLLENGITAKHIGRSKPKCFPNTAYNLNNAYNTGVLESTGDVIIILNDYTWLPPYSLERLMKHEDLFQKKYCISAVCKYWLQEPPNVEKDFAAHISIWRNHWAGCPAGNGWSKSAMWTPGVFELFYSAIPYDLLVEMNGFPECYDTYVDQIEPFIVKAGKVGAKFFVDKENVCEQIHHRDWDPPNQWRLIHHTSKGTIVKEMKNVEEKENCFNLKNRDRGSTLFPTDKSEPLPTRMLYSIPFKEGGKFCELGGGDNPKYHPCIDKQKLPTVDIVADLEKTFPIESESYDGVLSQFLLEHISLRKIRFHIAEMCRILKPGGVAACITANTKAQAALIAARPTWTGDEENALIFGGQDFPDNYHKCAFSPEYATQLFLEAGFSKVKIVKHVCPTDMIIEGYKGGEPKVSEAKVSEPVNPIERMKQSEWYRELEVKLEEVKHTPAHISLPQKVQGDQNHRSMRTDGVHLSVGNAPMKLNIENLVVSGKYAEDDLKLLKAKWLNIE